MGRHLKVSQEGSQVKTPEVVIAETELDLSDYLNLQDVKVYLQFGKSKIDKTSV
jgi:hypothetical protein